VLGLAELLVNGPPGSLDAAERDEAVSRMLEFIIRALACWPPRRRRGRLPSGDGMPAAFTKLASSCMILALSDDYRGFCAAIVLCL
jgi:hypothetical protein